MDAQILQTKLDSTTIRQEWRTMHFEFHLLVDSISPGDFRRPTIDTHWSVAEILTHMVQTLELMPRAIKSLRSGKDFLKLPNILVLSVNYFLVKMIALNATPQILLSRYDQAFDLTIQLWDGVCDDEWSNGAFYLGEGYKTLAAYYKSSLLHFDEHAAQIRRSLTNTQG